MDRVSVEQAARILGIKEESVRKRVSRGKLRADKDADGRLLVYVDRSETVRDEYEDLSRTADSAELVDELRSHIADLRSQLEAERTSSAELRRIVAALTQRIPELPPAPDQEPPESHEEPAESASRGSGIPTPPPGSTAPQTASERVSWWRRVFGG